MKTSKAVLDLLFDSKLAMSSADIARRLPGFSQKQVQCALTRLVDSGYVKYRYAMTSVFGNNKPNRVYWISEA